MGEIPRYDVNSELKSITYIEGVDIQRVHYLGQPIGQSYVYKISDTSVLMAGSTFVRRFTIYLIDRKGIITEWRNYEKGTKDSVSYVYNREELIEI